MRWNIINSCKTNPFSTNQANSIEWLVNDGETHMDDIEMAGFGCAFVVGYGCENGKLKLTRHPVFPTLRLRPNNTHATYQKTIPDEFIPQLIINDAPADETLFRVTFNGILKVESSANGAAITREFYPAKYARAAFEKVTVTNIGTDVLTLDISCRGGLVDQTMGPMGINEMRVSTDFDICRMISSKVSYTFYISYVGQNAFHKDEKPSPEAEYEGRLANVNERLTAPLKLCTGNATLDTMFNFAKLRAGESVFDTMYGKIHSPGGYSYYAATWCNDQVEYAGPYFAYTGDEELLEASMNAYRMYMPFMSEKFEPIPSSVIAEGVDYWNGAGDRGDAAMYLYGASRFALTSGSRDYAEELLPAIEWCAEYCKRKINEQGVIASDSDELEGRFPSGDANLCTSTLAYSGYLCAAALEEELGSPELGAEYREIAAKLRSSIDAHFGADIHDMHTYRYYDGCEVLRSWICMPLCVGIYDRAEGTVAALTSDYIMKPDGMLTTEDNQTIWDRSTLYGLRGILASGDTECGMKLLLHYAENRLLGERVPYAVEAYPEGGRRHLSGESALFCKVIIEGLLDMTPTGLHSFTIKPSLPTAIDHLYLDNIRAHGAIFDVHVERTGFTVTRKNGLVIAEGKIGETVEVKLGY